MSPARAPRLWLLRHAQPRVAPGICYGRLDVPADAALTAQAAHHFSAAWPAGAVLRSSPLQRCGQLAQALQPGGGQPPARDPRLQEMDFGQWEGQAWDAIARPAIDAWAANLLHMAPGDGESLASMLQRVQSALLHSWASDSQHGRCDVAWVTHAGVIRCVQWLLRHHPQQPTSADWRLPAPGFGQWLEMPWAAAARRLHALSTATEKEFSWPSP